MAGPAAERRKNELENLKNIRIKHIIECAFGLFSENGIDNVSMNDIAASAEIGVASLYRYFQTKEELAIEAAIYAWEIEKNFFEEVYTSEEFKTLNGFCQIKSLLEVFEDAIVSQKSFFSYIYYFDSFITKEKVSQEALNKYENTIVSVNSLVFDAIEKGIKDGSIKYKTSSNQVISAATIAELYFSMMHSLFCLAQKLSISGELLSMDKIVDERKQVEILVNMILISLKGE